MKRNVGIILAGGKGERFGTVPPKQFTFVGEKMLIEYTIENLTNAKSIDEIIITVNPHYKDLGKKLASKYKKVIDVIEGGRTRTESIYNSALAINKENYENAVFIDAVRPFVPYYVFDEFIQLLNKYDVVKFCSRIVDYLAFTNNSENILRIDKRDQWRLCKAPVGYRTSLLKKLTKIPREEIIKYESDLEIVLKNFPHAEIYAYESEEFNFKITYKKDLEIAAILLKHLPKNV